MIGILVVSHEPFGSALVRCTRHVYGRLAPQLAALDILPDESPELALAAGRDLLARINDGSGAIVLTDVFGATPSRIALQLAVPDRVRVLAGVNLPILLKALQNRRLPVDELARLLRDSGRRSICLVDRDDDCDAGHARTGAGQG